MDVNELQKQRMAHKIVHQSQSSRQPRVLPVVGVRVRNVEAGDGAVNHLVGVFRHHPFDFLLVRRVEKTHGWYGFVVWMLLMEIE